MDGVNEIKPDVTLLKIKEEGTNLQDSVILKQESDSYEIKWDKKVDLIKEEKIVDFEFARSSCATGDAKQRSTVLTDEKRAAETTVTRNAIDCNVCGVSLSSTASLSHHMTKVHKKKIKTEHKCNICDKTFADTYCLNRHSLTHADLNVKSYPCKVCEKKFASKASVEKHLRYLHGTTGRPYMCALCDKKYKYKADLAAHIRHKHNANTDIEVGKRCEFCNKLLGARTSMLNHYQTHLTDKHYKCTICDKTFGRKYMLTEHMLTHAGKGELHCHICKKQFATKVMLNQHLSQHAASSRLYKCEICYKEYASRYFLKAHMPSHTGEKPHKCTSCSKSFLHVSGLKYHVANAHSMNRQFKCDACPKSYSLPHLLMEHCLIHTGEKPHCCETCGEGFRLRIQLKRHLKRHSPRLD